MTPQTEKEKHLFMMLQNCAEEKSKWVNIVYFLVMYYGEKSYDDANALTGCVLNLPDVSAVPIPLPDNPLDWAYDKENDKLIFTIKEDPKNLIVVPREKIH
jgi:hypothetical protein